MTIVEELFAMQDSAYGDFQAKLTPGIPREQFIGVRVPDIRKLAKRILNCSETANFLKALPHYYYDENMLHGLLISEYKDFDSCVLALDLFLPYVDNWAVCDILSPKVLKKNKKELLCKIREWVSSEKTYTCRFGIEMLQTFFLDEDFLPLYLDIPANVHSEEYYVRMMIAWFFATSLVKQWDATIPYLENKVLDVWVHNKTIQKACESRCITQEKKEYLKTLKR